jgi:hypothetical protein
VVKWIKEHIPNYKVLTYLVKNNDFLNDFNTATFYLGLSNTGIGTKIYPVLPLSKDDFTSGVVQYKLINLFHSCLYSCLQATYFVLSL